MKATVLPDSSHDLASNEGAWLTSKVVINVADPHDATKDVTRTFRCWNARAMTHNFFTDLNESIVKKLPKDVHMSNEAMLITTNKNKPGGFLVLASDKVSPDLNKNGANNIEGLLAKNG